MWIFMLYFTINIVICCIKAGKKSLFFYKKGPFKYSSVKQKVNCTYSCINYTYVCTYNIRHINTGK